MKKSIIKFAKNNYKRVLLYLISLIVLYLGYFIFRVILAVAPEFSGLPYGITKALFGVVTLKLVDDLLFYEVPTIQRLKDEPIGYAVYLLGYALIIALCISAA